MIQLYAILFTHLELEEELISRALDQHHLQCVFSS
jgi:hypothetical protein